MPFPRRNGQTPSAGWSAMRWCLYFIIAFLLVFLLTGFFQTDPPPESVKSAVGTDSNLRINPTDAGTHQTTKTQEQPVTQPQTPAVHHPEAQPPIRKKPTVAYAITVTKDGPFLDGALVLGYAAKKFHDFNKGYPSAFAVELVAFVAPKVTKARPVLEKYGWRILERPLPVALDEIKNKEYADKMRDSGCCGADEFLKLWAYTLTEYHRVIHLDMDSIIFKNMDELFLIDKELLFTGDYNMKGGSPVPPAQGGFLVVRPSMQTFEEFRSVIREGNHGSRGWGGSRIGNFWGGQTIQGIVPYFYHVLHPGEAQEMNRCVYNCMVDNPYHPKTTRCLDGNPTCEDCRLQQMDKVSSAHFTICQKPWTCTAHTNPRNKVLCEQFHNRWFQLRDEFEKDLNIDPAYRAQSTLYKESLGMCGGWGPHKYKPIPISA